MSDDEHLDLWVPPELEKALEDFRKKKTYQQLDFFNFDLPPPLPEATDECSHEWKAVVGLKNTWYNCKKCDIKKEDYDKERK